MSLESVQAFALAQTYCEVYIELKGLQEAYNLSYISSLAPPAITTAAGEETKTISTYKPLLISRAIEDSLLRRVSEIAGWAFYRIEENRQQIQEFIKRPTGVTKIPDWIASQLRKSYICPLTRRAIRFIVYLYPKPSREEKPDNPVYYEKLVLEGWIKNNLDKLPPNCPEGIASRNLLKCVRTDRKAQRIINNELERIAKEMTKKMGYHKRKR